MENGKQSKRKPQEQTIYRKKGEKWQAKISKSPHYILKKFKTIFFLFIGNESASGSKKDTRTDNYHFQSSAIKGEYPLGAGLS